MPAHTSALCTLHYSSAIHSHHRTIAAVRSCKLQMPTRNKIYFVYNAAESQQCTQVEHCDGSSLSGQAVRFHMHSYRLYTRLPTAKVLHSANLQAALCQGRQCDCICASVQRSYKALQECRARCCNDLHSNVSYTRSALAQTTCA
eukprot:13366-Heterococcus_DN1.PRE.5